MPAARGRRRTTTERGLGREHQQRRAALLPGALGTRCPGVGKWAGRCGVLMVDPRRMDLDHTVPRALGGTVGDRIVCSRCNRSAGATLGNQLRRRVRTAARTVAPSRDWF